MAGYIFKESGYIFNNNNMASIIIIIIITIIIINNNMVCIGYGGIRLQGVGIQLQ